jgi:hypothetical protein
MDDRYAQLGLCAMARAGEPFMAHFGAALVAAWWLDHDSALAPPAAEVMVRQADRMIAKHSWLFEETAIGPPARDATPRLVASLEPWLDRTWAIGHDVIYVALAARTLQERPALCDDAMLHGLHQLLDACHQQPLVDIAQHFDVTGVQPDAGMDVAAPDALARVALETAVGFRHVYPGLQQGHIGHVLDHAHAIVVLERLGHRGEAARARLGFTHHVAALRHVWDATMDLREVAAADGAGPETPHYWDRDLDETDWAVGHVFKYPYAFFELSPLVDDENLVEAARRRLLQLV